MNDLRVLIIDDSKSVHAFLKLCLKSITQNVESVFDGHEAIKKISSVNYQYDLIFLDWEMPIKDGPTTFDELKTMGLKTPILMLTSKNAIEDITKMLDAGVTDYLMKPFTEDIIVAKVNALFAERKRAI